jgi:hypothetical protein
MKKPILVLGCILAVLAWAQKPAPPAVDEKLPLEPPEQPIPFNHKLHVSKGVECKNCHAIKDPGYQAGYPREAVCMGCHAIVKPDSPAIKKLAEHAKSKTAVAWVKVYKVPDYVWFSHASHVTEAGVTCDTCHGNVAEREVMFKEKPTNMHSCMQCHAKNKAPNGCDFCHNSQ